MGWMAVILVVAGLVYSVMGVVTFGVFWWDKVKAGMGGWRVPEGTLLGLAALGGVWGALVAMYVLRHKNRKTGFTLAAWGLGVVHGVGLIASVAAVVLLAG